ncbi:MAG: S9 family peptidase [Bryobacteraceae bacterium]|nr:S9 family peptidase [Bryobacteraceae bacterium]
MLFRCLPFLFGPLLFAQLTSNDLYRLRSAGNVSFSPDGARLAYTVNNNEKPGRPYSQIWVRELAGGRETRFGGPGEASSGPLWSPDGQWIAYSGKVGDKSGLVIARPDGTGAKFLHELQWTNSPLPETGKRYTWSPDSKSIAFVSSIPGPETADATGDPVVITRYLYKPDLDEGNTRFNDNRRPKLYTVEIASGTVKQLTTGATYEHSVDWSPSGDEIVFVSNREPDQDIFHNYDLFAWKLSDGSTRRITATESCEYIPRWSPDGKSLLYLGTRRGLTDLETTMEDTHLWVVSADGRERREIGAAVDNRQDAHSWSPDGRHVYFTLQERGSVNLYRMPVGGGAPEAVVKDRGAVSSYSVARNGTIAYTFTSPGDLAQVYVLEPGKAARKLTDLNAAVLSGKQMAEVESFTFVSNDNKWEVEAFLTKPLGMTAASRHPLIVSIHGGPHGQRGPGFQHKNQVYAAQGFGVLQVNFRGSTGYGQKFADAVFRDQNGDEGMDVLYGVSAALRRYGWIDRERLGVEGGSYGGQLTCWLITQTHIFKAAIPFAAITNLISYNYMTYYNQYEEMEWGARPHQGNLMDLLWERSALKHVGKAKTPTLILHGENDNDVPIAEVEQFYIALKDVGVETVMVRYPREGHGLRETKHQIDSIDRSIAWYNKYFSRPAGQRTGGGQ